MVTSGTRPTPSRTNQLSDSDGFLDLVGHELRTPVTVLRGNIQLLQRRFRKRSDREDDLSIMNTMLYQIERLNHQLDVYLASVHIEQKRFAEVVGPGDLVAIARRLVTIYSGGKTDHTLTLETSLCELPGMWDVRRIEVVMSELIANAIKYSPEGAITIRIDRVDDIARVEVRDHGIGIPPKERFRVFEPRVHATNVENAGAGLGLFVAREVIRNHHGKIGLRSAPGGGSVFWFTIPVATPRNLSAGTSRPQRADRGFESTPEATSAKLSRFRTPSRS